MCKPNDEITTVVKDLMDVKAMITELEAEAEALTDQIKAYMGDEETMLVGNTKVMYKEIASKRVDTNALRKVLGDDALEPYTKLVVSRRFAIN